MTNATPFIVTYCGCDFDPTTYRTRDEFTRDVWASVFAETDNGDWANDSALRADHLWLKAAAHSRARRDW